MKDLKELEAQAAEAEAEMDAAEIKIKKANAKANVYFQIASIVSEVDGLNEITERMEAANKMLKEGVNELKAGLKKRNSARRKIRWRRWLAALPGTPDANGEGGA